MKSFKKILKIWNDLYTKIMYSNTRKINPNTYKKECIPILEKLIQIHIKKVWP